MDRTWVVVSDASRARIFETGAVVGQFEEVTTLVHPASRLHRRDIDADGPGRSYYSSSPERHSVSPSDDPKEHTASQFAKEVVAYLDKARVEERFRYLMLIAPPPFLGRLRAELRRPLRERIIAEMSKEISQLEARDIRTYLPDAQQVASGRRP